MDIYLAITVKDSAVEPIVTISNQNWQSGKAMSPDSLEVVRKSGKILDRVLDFADAIKS